MKTQPAAVEVSGVCEFCDRPFLYRAVPRANRGIMKRRVCPGCAQIRRTLIRQRSKARARVPIPVADIAAQAALKSSTEAIAAALGLSVSAVARLEQVALAKIRKTPGLHKLWDNLKADGFPLPDARCGLLARDKGLALLEYEGAVSAWWETHDRLAAQAAASGVDLSAELAECQAEIAAFQQRLKTALQEAMK